MTIVQQIEKIKADIAALPKEYRTLVTTIEGWEASHVAMVAAACFALGYMADVLVKAPF